MTLIPSSHSIEKYAEPSGIKVARGGDTVEFIIEPKVFGLWDDSTSNTAIISDNSPNGTDYIANSEMFSSDGGITWYTRIDWDAGFTNGLEDVSITSLPHVGGADPLSWRFGSLESSSIIVNAGDVSDKLPLIKCQVFVDPDTASPAIPYVVTADVNGMYTFDNLPADTYRVEVTPPTGVTPIYNADGIATPNISAYDLQDETDASGQLIGVENNEEQDFGYQPLVQLGSTVWLDENNSGTQDGVEAGISSVVVQLFAAGANPLATVPIAATTTSLTGDYLFSVPPGDYFVYIPTPPSEAILSSTPPVTDIADNQQDGDDNGTQAMAGEPVRSPDINDDGSVLIEWATQTEVANLGFYIYAQIEGEWLLLNESLVLAQGDSVLVQSYSASVTTNVTVFALSDIDLNGRETLHGPYILGQAQGAIANRKVIDWAAEKAERALKSDKRKQLRKQQQMQNSKRRLQLLN